MLTNANGAPAILPPEYAQLIITPVLDDALAFDSDVATIIRTEAHEFHLPVLNEDAAANWVAEGDEITPSAPNLAEAVVVPAKVAGLTVVSRELAQDSNPSAQRVVGESLARAIVRQVDAAFLGALPAPAPAGLGTLTNSSTITGASLNDLDVFAQAVAEAENNGGNTTAFIMNPTDALALAEIKTGTGSNQALLNDPRTILGRPVKVNKNVPQGTIWAVDKTRIFSVIREDTTLAVSPDAFFSSDRIALRATMRIGFAVAQSKALVKITTKAD